MKIINLKNLCELLQLSSAQIKSLDIDYQQQFIFKVPLHFAQQMGKKNINDPLLLQVLPVQKENEIHTNFFLDPVEDLKSTVSKGLLYKYNSRVLLIVSPKCDIHCRYCFRRNFPYKEHVNQNNWKNALDYIAQNTSIKEVILSGGDPMTLNEDVIVKLCQKIENIQSVQTLRIHTRTPIVSPEDSPQKSFIQFCKQTRLNIVVVVHCNHPNELSTDTDKLLQIYRQANITLLNQAVLLKKINDNVNTLVKLSYKLLQQGILPYYLHQIDKVSGSKHFEVSIPEAKILMENLHQELPGYLVPKWVKEIPNAPYKVNLFGEGFE